MTGGGRRDAPVPERHSVGRGRDSGLLSGP